MKKAPKSCGCVSHSRAVFFAKLNETGQTAPMRRIENIFSEHFRSKSFLKYGICSLFPLKNCSNRRFSGLVVDCR